MTRTAIKLEECPLQQNSQCQKRPLTFKGPLRVVRLCILGIALPTALISVPLYMRYHVYANQLYPFAVSDMRVLDRRISTVWCQKQLVKVNATFNAFLLSHPPRVAPDQKRLSMVRDLLLEDDMKEYWGFYLLNGSTVTVSTCCRWPGASLTVIRGHKHLHECAYIGDDSSEELDELLEAMREGVYVKSSDSSEDDALANAPQLMMRHRPDVLFHHPMHNNNSHNMHNEEVDDTSDITDPKLLKNLLDALSKKTDKSDRRRQKLLEEHTPPKRKQQNSAVPTQNDPNNRRLEKVPITQQNRVATHGNKDLFNESENLTSSEELFIEVSRKLDALGDRQHKVLQKLNARSNQNSTANQENQNHDSINPKGNSKQISRRKRDLILTTAMLDNLNSDDEERDAAIEEGFTSDGIADHRGFVNETTLNDRSDSEFWSSFSSSEEALLSCEGLILNLPLTPHPNCQMDLPEEMLKDASLTNTITYSVPKNGYYFFIFNSENEVQVNYIRVRFEINKTMYDVSHPKSTCTNKTEECGLDLGFFSEERMVMEVPVTANESRWNEEFIVVSECEPRTLLYMCCVLSVPVLIILFAFQ